MQFIIRIASDSLFIISINTFMSTLPGKKLSGWVNEVVIPTGDDYQLPGLPLNGSHIHVRHYKRADEDTRQHWVKFSDPLLQKYNFTPQGTIENDITYQKLKDRIRLAVDDLKGQLIGYVSFKLSKRDPDAVELGICFSADQVSRGYGKETLKLVLPWICRTLYVERILLEVDAVNTRAIKLYQKLGFEKYGQSWYSDFNPLLHAFAKQLNRTDVIRCRGQKVQLLSWIMLWKNEALKLPVFL
jgi:RimJ/RimL family protein N-acetyltransferase